MPNVIDEFTRGCLAIRVARRPRGADVIDALSDPFILRGAPAHVRPDNGPEFAAEAVRAWTAGAGARTAHIAPGPPWENGYRESFSPKLRDGPLDGRVFYSLQEARAATGAWRRHHSTVRPRSALGLRAARSRGGAAAGRAPRGPAPAATRAAAPRPATHQRSARTTRRGPANPEGPPLTPDSALE